VAFKKGAGQKIFSTISIMATRKNNMKKHGGGSRKGKRAPSAWNKLVMKVYREMKAKDKNVKFGAALKAASKRKSEM
jgi:hypothetical protein